MAVERKPAPVLDLSRPERLEVEVDVSEAAEVLMSICALGDPDDFDMLDLGTEHLRELAATVPPDLHEGIESMLLGSGKVAAHLLGIVYETPAPRTFPAFLDRLAAIDPAELKLHLFGHYGGAIAHDIAPEVIERAVRGDADAQEEYLRALDDHVDKRELVRGLFGLGGAEVKARLLDVLPRWYDHVFAPFRDDWQAEAERDAAVKRPLAQQRTPEQLVELAARGYQYVPTPGIRRLVLFPSWWMRPWVVLWEHRGTKILCYPIAPATAERAAPAEVARVYKALGDEGRLKLLRRLSEGPLRLTEAAAELGVAKSTAHHHLAILRQAGFVTIRDEDESVYSLQPDLPQAGELLAGYLGSSGPTTGR